MVAGDLPEYESPITGLPVRGRKARADDLARHNCRPYEGFEQEKKEVDRQIAYAMKQEEAAIGVAVERAWYQLPPERREILGGGV